MAEPWEVLFGDAMAILDSFTAPEWVRWSFGGGTALMLQIGHRESHDINIFVNDPQMLGFVSPRLNDVAASVCENYLESAGYTKLSIPPHGEIDFIVAPALTSYPWKTVAVGGREVLLETPAEIVVKKLFFRADGLEVRDVFDVAATERLGDESLVRHAGLLAGKLDILERRLAIVSSRYQTEAGTSLAVLPAGMPILGTGPQVVAEVFREMRAKLGDDGPSLRRSGPHL